MSDPEKIINTRGGPLLMRRAGSGAPVLFLHGAGGATGWVPFYQQMATHYDFMVPDHPSFGRSPTPPWLDDIPDLAYYYLDLLDELGIKQAHIIGHSMGGWLALEMAIRSIERFKSLTLIAPAGIRIKGAPITNVFIMDPPTLMNHLFANKAIVDQMLAMTPTPAQIDEAVTNRVASARLAWHPRFFNPKLEKWLHRVTAPTQIIWGDQDKIVPPVYAPRFKELIPHASLTMVKDAGHIPFAEKTGEVMSTITNFIGRNS